MAVWGGRFKFDDISTTRHDFSRHGPAGSFSRLQERVTSAPAANQVYKPRQRLRPKDTFTSPQPPILGSSQQRPCPLGCPCNQNDRVLASYDPHDLDSAMSTCNRLFSSSQDHNYCGPNMSSSYHNNTQSQCRQPPTMQKPQSRYPDSTYRPMSSYISRPPPVMTRERPMSSPLVYSNPANSCIPRTQPIPPRNAIPVGWGRVDLNTVYLEHFTDPHTMPGRFAQSPYVSTQQPRPESPPRWETSYSSAFCKNLLQITKAF